ncbi:cytosolic-abundant heat soluble protein 89226-like [Paramacrobiotus metropolitanus]|uniref:cytosolic-abundant heat soluble protein 89226-like n=1 Tax=Paramacrobiotus metropolitanus TaxID=2943436 RepID=UPI0024463ABD|nr:cytosolic-abundant heat soluble protein 89226-like [Paramacrobiotus metropolitanus]
MANATAPSYAVNLNPAGLPEGKEFKYERVEKAKVDSSGHAKVVDIREDIGGEDPGMNFKDKRPDVPPGVPIGVVPSSVTESGTAPEVPKNIPGPFISEEDSIHSRESHDAVIVGHLPNNGHTLKKMEVENITKSPDSISMQSGSNISRTSQQALPGATGTKEVHERVTSKAPDTASIRSGSNISRASDQEVANKIEKTSIHDMPTGKSDPEYSAKTEQKVKDDGRKVTKTEEHVQDDMGHATTKKKFEEAAPDESRV